MAQFRERAEPSEALEEIARKSAGPLFVNCIALSNLVVSAIAQNKGKEVHYRRQPEAAEPHCFSLPSPNSAGQLIRVTKQVATGKHGLFY
jgi:hypothetical protein